MADHKALNEKLALFCGFKIPINEYDGKPFKHGKNSANLWESQNGDIISELPDLVNSLDAQAKWIYPKLNIYHIQKNYLVSPRKWNVDLYEIGGEIMFSGYNESESMALALAVEKLIDSMDGKND